MLGLVLTTIFERDAHFSYNRLVGSQAAGLLLVSIQSFKLFVHVNRCQCPREVHPVRGVVPLVVAYYWVIRAYVCHDHLENKYSVVQNITIKI